MVISIKNSEGFIIAYVESTKVDMKGKYNSEGTFIRIENVWVHPLHRDRSTLKRLIKRLDKFPLYKNCTGLYWVILRDKNNKKIIDDVYREPIHKHLSKLYSKEKLVNQIIGDLTCSKNYSE